MAVHNFIAEKQRGRERRISCLAKRSLKSLCFSLGLLIFSPVWAQAMLLPPGQTVTVHGTSLAQHSELAGTILQDRNEPFVIDFGSGHRVAGTVQVRVMREEIDGTLDFYYHFTVTENTALGQCCNRLVVGTGFTGVLTEVEVRTDSLGNTSPLQASRSADGSEISFDFSPGLLPADESLFFFVRTDAISFKEGDKGSLAQGELSVTQFPVLQPEGEAASVQP